MAGEPRSSREVLENGLKEISSFLRLRSLPGKARLNRRDSPEPQSSGAGAAGTHGSTHQPAKAVDAEASGASAASRDSPATRLSVSATAEGDAAAVEALEQQVATLDVQRSCTDEASTSAPDSPAVSQTRSASLHRVKRFHKVLLEPVVDLDALRELSWSGIPAELRPLCWRLLLGYLPPNRSRQTAVLLRKRREYQDMVPEIFDIANSERNEDEIGALRQVSVDVPRTAPNVPLFHEERIQKSLERMLYIWGIRHTATGYVQGMNDLVTPFVAVFLSEHLPGPVDSWTTDVLETLPENVMLDVEADCYWCLCKLLEGIQDHFTYAQPGIQRTVFRLKELTRRVNEPVAQHLEEQNVEYLQFAFRWVNCLLIRELPFPLAIRLWDTYLAEGTRFSDFLVYVCAGFLLTWERELRSMEFQDLLMFLQKLPTAEWSDRHIETVLSRAYVWRTSFGDAQSHLRG